MAGGQEAGAARLQVFDLSAQSRPAAMIDLPGEVVREILPDGPRFVVASSAAQHLPLLSRMFVTVIEGRRVASQDEVPARLLLRWGYVGSRAMVVAGDDEGNIVVTRLGGGGSERIPVRAPDPLGPIGNVGAVYANAASAYGQFSSYVIRVDLERMQQVESGIVLVAGEHLAAVTANDRWLLTTRVEDRQRREFTVGAYCVGCADVRWGHWAGWLPGVPVEMLVVGSQIAVASVEDPFPRPDEFGLTLWEIGENGLQQIGHHRLPGRLSISQLHEQPDFVLLSSADLPAPARGNQSDGGGCAVGGTRSSGFPLWVFLLLLGTCAVRRRALLVAFLLLAVVLPGGAKVIANGATMRIDAGPLQPAPQPNGPAYARPIPRGATFQGGGDANDQRGLWECSESGGNGGVTYEMELALDIQENWRPWFNDDVQLLINYLAGTFELLDGTFRDAGVRVVITHLQIRREVPLPVYDHCASERTCRLQTFWEESWPRCLSPGDPSNCIHRDAVYGLWFNGLDSHGAAWVGQPCTGLAYGWATWAPVNDLTTGSPYQTAGNKMWAIHTVGHELTHLLGSCHGNEFCPRAIWHDCDRS